MSGCVLIVALVPAEDAQAAVLALPTASIHAHAEIDPAALKHLPLKDFADYYARPATDAVIARHRETHGGI